MRKNQRSSLLCPNCRRLISADEPRCPFCGISTPGARWKNNLLMRGLANPQSLIRFLLYVNGLMFFVSLMLHARLPGLSLNPLSALAPDNDSLFRLGATGTIPIDHYQRWWTLVSANYLHGGILHIVFNMIALNQLAPFVLREFGAHRTFIIYTLGGVCGFFISYLAGIAFTIGASAAVCALMGAILYYGKSRGGSYGQALYRQVAGWAIGIFLFGLVVPGINNWGHGAGMLAGAVLGYLLGYQERRRETFNHKLVSGICLIVTLLTLGWALISGVFYR
jgi:rhomboid protease GluP